ncbi:MAG: GAF domain-containing protein [Bacteroidales bacterium]|nr:GAF domain-containing protein [Bacteroidales bacterium]
MDKKKKDGRYSRMYTQLESLMEKCRVPHARMATISSVLHNKMEYFFWTGFYVLVDGEMTVHNYQGPVACQVLKKDSGVCWAGYNKGETIVVPNVCEFPDHIACDSRSNSEIVVPLKNKQGEIIGVLDVDSKDLNSFDEVDALWLEKIVALVYGV